LASARVVPAASVAISLARPVNLAQAVDVEADVAAPVVRAAAVAEAVVVRPDSPQVVQAAVLAVVAVAAVVAVVVRVAAADRMEPRRSAIAPAVDAGRSGRLPWLIAFRIRL
jgi:hypothetical protein